MANIRHQNANSRILLIKGALNKHNLFETIISKTIRIAINLIRVEKIIQISHKRITNNLRKSNRVNQNLLLRKVTIEGYNEKPNKRPSWPSNLTSTNDKNIHKVYEWDKNKILESGCTDTKLGDISKLGCTDALTKTISNLPSNLEVNLRENRTEWCQAIELRSRKVIKEPQTQKVESGKKQNHKSTVDDVNKEAQKDISNSSSHLLTIMYPHRLKKVRLNGQFAKLLEEYETWGGNIGKEVETWGVWNKGLNRRMWWYSIKETTLKAYRTR